MVRAGRSSCVAFVHLSCLFYGAFSVSLVASTDYGIPIEIKLWDSKRSPLAHMVDVTNEFGLKLLLEHNFLNDNNIAFSPYGLMGIMVALYEGVDGESSYQIQRSMQLPWNRNIMRIGFRDIHRTLKTYFVPEEGFLAGLALNNENVTFTDSYKKILRFYGFDLESDESPSKPNNKTDSTQSTTVGQDSSTTASLTTVQVTTTKKVINREDPSQSTKATREETTLNPLAETINTTDIREPTSATTITALTTSVTPSGTTVGTTTQNEVTQSTIQTTNSDISTIMAVSSTTEMDRTTNIPSTQTPQGSSETSPMISMSTGNPTSETTSVLPSTSDMEAMSMIDSTTATDVTSSTQMTDPSSISGTEQTEQTSTIQSTEPSTTDSSSTTSDTSTLETLERRKKSIVDFLFTHPPYAEDYLVYRSFNVGIDLTEENPYEDDKMFLVNGLRNIQVSYMHYDSVMEYAYLPHLEASALRLPLDSDRYYLLAVLPTRRGPAEIGRLLARMARESDLSDVYAALHPRRVRAVVPSFIVKGHVSLTTDLQKLGIRDVFEPRQHDFTPMTHQPGVYVRSIEQAVSVAIRKYQPDDVKNRYITRNPVFFSATHPFLYFVMDSNIHVALMAGKMVDPLNTRIL